MKTKVLMVVGTRPEAIKMAPLVLEFQKRKSEFQPLLCSTGQHRQMLDQVFATFGLQPDFELNIMTPGQTLAQVTARAAEGLDKVFETSRPNIVLVQGDTTSAFVGALIGYYHRVAVGHIEAGLRTGDKFAPFPEEMNRRLVTRLADWHFPPTEFARSTLLSEGVDPNRVFVTGNTVIDAMLLTRSKVRQKPPDLPKAVTDIFSNNRVVLVTGHRRESFGEGFENICRAIRRASDANPDVSFVYPMHLNPNVREPVERILSGQPRIHLIEPLSYEPFVWMMDKSVLVLTDSGGVQEEAPSLGKPVLVMRDTTERPEGIEAGNALLVGTSEAGIHDNLCRLLNDPATCTAMARIRNPYGDGTAAKQTVDILAAEMTTQHNGSGSQVQTR